MCDFLYIFCICYDLYVLLYGGDMRLKKYKGAFYHS